MASQPIVSAALMVETQGITVSSDDRIRIERSAQSGRYALEKIQQGTLFDTEPAHFDRFQISSASGGTE